MNSTELTANNIRTIRSELRISSKFMCQKLNVCKSTYSNIENGKIELTLSRLEIVAEIFKKPISDIIVSKVKLPSIKEKHEAVMKAKEAIQLLNAYILLGEV